MYKVKTMKSCKIQGSVLLDQWNYNQLEEVEQVDRNM
jgi:hypothetical protein